MIKPGKRLHLPNPSLIPEPRVKPPLDPVFRPGFLFQKSFEEAVRQSGKGVPLRLALERSGKNVSVYSTQTFSESHLSGLESGHLEKQAAFQHAERILKFLLWQRGGAKVCVSGPPSIVDHFKKNYAPGGERAFDADFMAKVFERPVFEVVGVNEKDFPKANESSSPVGRHLD